MTVDDTFLLICTDKGKIIPVCSQTFTVTQSSLASVNSDYRGCRIIYRNGSTAKFLFATKVGLWGEGVIRKVISALTSAYMITTEFEPAGTISLNEFKTTVCELLALDDASGDPNMPQQLPLSQVFEMVNSAQTITAVFDCINMPSVEDCLDVL